MTFNTFDQVAEWYNNTKPLGGKDNKDLDIRPIGARRYKHNRIMKYDDNTYALLDGYFDPHWSRSVKIREANRTPVPRRNAVNGGLPSIDCQRIVL